MNYAQVRDQVLKLLNQYTVAGEPVRDTYNNQQDYLNKIPGLVNDAMMEIATTAVKIPATLRLADLPEERENGMVRYELPEDFFQLKSGSVVKAEKGRLLHTGVYTMQGRKCMVMPEEEAGDCCLDYYRYPMLLAEKPDDGDELDNVPETHCAIPFYAAAFLVAHDDPYLCALFNNKYADKLNNMRENLTAQTGPVGDSYRFFG